MRLNPWGPSATWLLNGMLLLIPLLKAGVSLELIMVNYMRWLTLMLGLLILSGCTHYSHDRFPVVVLDDANILNKKTRDWLNSFEYPAGYYFVISTKKEIPYARIGLEADDQFDAVAKRISQGAAFQQRGILLVITQRPYLVQLRTGKDFYYQARWAGVSSGEKYVNQQLALKHLPVNVATINMVKWVAENISNADTLPWYKKWLLFDSLQTLYLEFDSLSLPSEGFYGSYILKPLIGMRLYERNSLQSWWITYVCIGGVLFLVNKLLRKVLIRPLIKRSSSAIGHVVALVLSIAFGLILGIPAAASAILLSGARLEDQIALKATGLPGIEHFAFDPTSFDVSTGLWAAFLIVALRIVKGLSDRGWVAGLATLPDNQQQEIFVKMQTEMPVLAFITEALGTRQGKSISIDKEVFLISPFTSAYILPLIDDTIAGIRWGLLAIAFLPLAYSLAAIYFWIVPTLAGLYTTAMSFKNRQLRFRQFVPSPTSSPS